MIRAYCEDYVCGAQRVLGDMLDFAVNTCEMEISYFWRLFLESSISLQFQNGNPAYIAGKTGCELAREVLRESEVSEPGAEDVMYIDKSPQYWTGWAIAFYQWYSGYSFENINAALPIEQVVIMYDPYHEMDILSFAQAAQEKYEAFYKKTNLRRRRENIGYTQKELAQLSQVPIRQIQLFEQRQRDINKAGSECVAKLAKALCCSCEDLLE